MFGVMLVSLGLFSQVLSDLSGSGFSIYDFAVSKIKCDCDRVDTYDVPKINVVFFNYETEDCSDTIPIDQAADTINDKQYISENQCVVIFIPGFNTPVTDRDVKSAQCLQSKITCNGKKVFGIIMDTYEYTKGGPTPLQNTEAYKKAVKYVKSIGVAIGNFINKLIQASVSKDNIHMIGHSLGAHTAGYTSERLKSLGILLKVIYGADPAKPCYSDCLDQHLRKGQASLVISFHTTMVLGTTAYVADYDFVAGDGKTQEECGYDVGIGLLEGKCSHDKCIPISMNPALMEGIWQAKKCSSYDDFKNKKCDDNECTLAGFLVTPDGSPGKYYFSPSSNLTCDITLFQK